MIAWPHGLRCLVYCSGHGMRPPQVFLGVHSVALGVAVVLLVRAALGRIEKADRKARKAAASD